MVHRYKLINPKTKVEIDFSDQLFRKFLRLSYQREPKFFEEVLKEKYEQITQEKFDYSIVDDKKI